MTVERALRGIAGIFVILSVLLAQYHSPNWLLFTAFVGLNLLQSSATNWCPMMTILKKLGLKSPCREARSAACSAGHPADNGEAGDGK